MYNEWIDFGFTLWIVLMFLVGMPMLLEWLWLFYKTIIGKENHERTTGKDDDLNTLIEQINDKERDYLDRWSDVEKSATIIQSLISMIKLDVLELLVKYKFDMKNLDLAMEEHHLSSNTKYLFDPDIINEGESNEDR